MKRPTLSVVPPDTEALWRLAVAANEAFAAAPSKETADGVIAAFGRFADAFLARPADVEAIKAAVRRRVESLLERAA